MKKQYKAIGASLMSLAFASTHGYAAEITWGASQNMADDTDVSTNGESRLALNTGSATSYTVNGVVFDGLSAPPIVPTNSLPFSTTITGAFTGFGRGSLAADAGDDLGDMVSSAFWGGASPTTTTFTNLVIGQEYEIQVFTNDARSSRNRNFAGMLSNGLDSEDPLYNDLAAVFELNNSPVDAEVDEAGPEHGDFLIGTFTADATSQSFESRGSTDAGVTANNAGRIQINAIQLRAIGEILEVPESDPKYWTGLTDGNLDSLTNNFSLNAAADPLNQGNLNGVNADDGIANFGDEYFADGAGVAVATSSLTIPAEAQPTATLFSFTNTSAVPYSVESVDSSGIVGAFTGVEGDGDGTLTLLGTHIYEGLTSIGAGYTLELGDGTTGTTLSSSVLVAGGNVNYDTTSGDTTFAGVITGGGFLTKEGSNTLTVEGNSTFNGTATVSEGSLLVTNRFDARFVDIASGAVMEASGEVGGRRADVTYTGEGILRKTGSFQLDFNRGTFALGENALIDVQEGEFRGGSSANENWTANLCDLNIATGALFSGVESNLMLDVITGSGTFTTGFSSAGYVEATIGVSNGSGTFDGFFNQTPDVVNATTLEVSPHPGNLRKVGTGTQTFNNFTDYTGNTVIEDGGLVYTLNSGMTFVPAENTVVNTVSGDPSTGTGFFDFDGIMTFEFDNADLTLGNYWTVIDPTNVAVTLGSNFQIELFVASETGGDFFPFTETAADSGIWELTTDEGVEVTFEEASYTLFVGEPFEISTEEIAIDASGFNGSGEFEVSFINLSSETTYQLKRSEDLLSFPTDVGATFTGATSNVFVDTAPPAGKAFYQLYEVTLP